MYVGMYGIYEHVFHCYSTHICVIALQSCKSCNISTRLTLHEERRLRLYMEPNKNRTQKTQRGKQKQKDQHEKSQYQ